MQNVYLVVEHYHTAEDTINTVACESYEMAQQVARKIADDYVKEGFIDEYYDIDDSLDDIGWWCATNKYKDWYAVVAVVIKEQSKPIVTANNIADFAP